MWRCRGQREVETWWKEETIVLGGRSMGGRERAGLSNDGWGRWVRDSRCYALVWFPYETACHWCRLFFFCSSHVSVGEHVCLSDRWCSAQHCFGTLHWLDSTRSFHHHHVRSFSYPRTKTCCYCHRYCCCWCWCWGADKKGSGGGGGSDN